MRATTAACKSHGYYFATINYMNKAMRWKGLFMYAYEGTKITQRKCRGRRRRRRR